jgi:hypothetical protein
VRRFVYIIDRLQSAALSPALSRQLPPASVASIRDGGRVIAWDDAAPMPAERRVPGTLSTERQMPWGTITENGEEYPVTLVWWTDWMPTPEELARRDGVRGVAWQGRDDREWILPLVLHRTGEVLLPSMRFVYPSAPETLPPYERLLAMGRDVYTAMRTGTNASMDHLQAFAVEAFRANYHVGLPELAALAPFWREDLVPLAALMAGVTIYDVMAAALAGEEKKIESGDNAGAMVGEGIAADGGGSPGMVGTAGGAG